MARPINTAKCLAEGCDNLFYSKGYCRQHWWRLKTYGRLEKIRRVITGNCIIEGCEKPIKGFGFCRNHYEILRSYKIDPREYAKLLKEQNFVCAICEQPETSLFHKNGKVKQLSVDHSHKTNKVRGLLCWRCNSFLGRVEENTEILQRMIDYLIKHKET